MARNAVVDQVLQTLAADTPVDRVVLGSLLERRPTPDDLMPLLKSPVAATVGAAVIYMGMYGSKGDSGLLLPCLRHEDPDVVGLAERCIWSLWMQGGSNEGNRHLAAAVECIKNGDYTGAIHLLRALVASEPGFAEAHFQWGVALCCCERPAAAASAYRETLRLNPKHFGAAAALGHTCVEQGDLPAAMHYYRRALRIHPAMEDVPAALSAVEFAARPRPNV